MLFIISLGGSVLVPNNINVRYLKSFAKLIKKYSAKHRFIIVTGGGKTARIYQEAAKRICNPYPEDLDWLGIHATRLNAHLLRTVLRNIAHPRIVKDPTKKIPFKKVLIAAGWKPCCSTDFDAVLLANTYKANTIINITCIDYLHNKDPRRYKSARKIKKATWQELQNIVGKRWTPGMNAPFDPIAVAEAMKHKLKLIIIGPSIKNLEALLSGRKFKGSVIE